MEYKQFQAVEALQPFIRCFYLWKDAQPNAPLIIESPPSSYNAIVFNFGDAYKVGLYDRNRQVTPQVFFTGQATKSYSLEFTGEIYIIGLVLKPTTLYHLIQVDQKQFVDQRCDLMAYLGSNIQDLYQYLRSVNSAMEQIEIISNYMDAFITQKNIHRDWLDHSVDDIDTHNGNIKFDEILEKYQKSKRYYQKVFLKRVGISPKSYMRTKRLSHVCYLLSTHQEVNWQDIVYEGGYFDQSHFIKDFTEFIGRNPTNYFKNNQELARILR